MDHVIAALVRCEPSTLFRVRVARARTRASFARLLHGEGLEIGALSDPLPIPHATRIVYSDWLPADAIERMYPGSRTPDILSDSESFPMVPDGSFDFVVATTCSSTFSFNN